MRERCFHPAIPFSVVRKISFPATWLFAVVNLARHLNVDPGTALRITNAKFERRFALIDRALANQCRSLGEASPDETDELWNQAKREER